MSDAVPALAECRFPDTGKSLQLPVGDARHMTVSWLEGPGQFKVG